MGPKNWPPKDMVDVATLNRAIPGWDIDPLLVPQMWLRYWLMRARKGGDHRIAYAYLAGRSLVAHRRLCKKGTWKLWVLEMFTDDTRVIDASMRIFLEAERLGGHLPADVVGGKIWQVERRSLATITSCLGVDRRLSRPPSAEMDRAHLAVLREIVPDDTLWEPLAPVVNAIRAASRPRVLANTFILAIIAVASLEAPPLPSDDEDPDEE